MRPAASEWDEREETPWPIIGEAAKIGLYGFEAIAQFWADETGLTLPLVDEELFWGDAGIGMAIMGTTLAVAAHLRVGHARAAGRVGAAVLRHAGGPQGGRLLRLGARRRLRRLLAAHPRPLRRGDRRVGPQRPEGVGHQRRHRQRPRGRGVGRSRAGRARAGGLRDPARDQGPGDGDQGPQARPARVAHRRRLPRRLPGSRTRACWAARTSSTSAWRAPARARARASRRRWRPSRSAGPRSAPRRSASPAPPTSTRSTTRRSARSSGARSSRTRPSRSRSPT